MNSGLGKTKKISAVIIILLLTFCSSLTFLKTVKAQLNPPYLYLGPYNPVNPFSGLTFASLLIDSSPYGTTDPPAGSYQVPIGAVVTISATPTVSGYRFSYWLLYVAGQGYNLGSANPLTFQMPPTAIEIAPEFAYTPAQYYSFGNLSINKYRCSPSENLTFTGCLCYNGTSTLAPDGDYSIQIYLANVQQGPTNDTLRNGNFTIVAAAQSTVGNYAYAVTCVNAASNGTYSTVSVDKLGVIITANATTAQPSSVVSFSVSATCENNGSADTLFSYNILRNGTHLTSGMYPANFTDSHASGTYNYTIENVTDGTVTAFDSNTVWVAWGSNLAATMFHVQTLNGTALSSNACVVINQTSISTDSNGNLTYIGTLNDYLNISVLWYSNAVNGSFILHATATQNVTLPCSISSILVNATDTQGNLLTYSQTTFNVTLPNGQTFNSTVTTGNGTALLCNGTDSIYTEYQGMQVSNPYTFYASVSGTALNITSLHLNCTVAPLTVFVQSDIGNPVVASLGLSVNGTALNGFFNIPDPLYTVAYNSNCTDYVLPQMADTPYDITAVAYGYDSKTVTIAQPMQIIIVLYSTSRGGNYISTPPNTIQQQQPQPAVTPVATPAPVPEIVNVGIIALVLILLAAIAIGASQTGKRKNIDQMFAEKGR
jgi:hypothetical protein